MEMPLGHVMPELTKVTWSEPSRRERPMQGFCPHSLQKRYLAGSRTQHTTSNMVLNSTSEKKRKNPQTFIAYIIEKHTHWPTWTPSSYPSHDYTLMGIRLYLIPYVIVLLFFRKVLEPQMTFGARPLSMLQNLLLFPRMHSFTIHQHLYMGFLKVPESLLMGKSCWLVCL